MKFHMYKINGCIYRFEKVQTAWKISVIQDHGCSHTEEAITLWGRHHKFNSTRLLFSQVPKFQRIQLPPSFPHITFSRVVLSRNFQIHYLIIYVNLLNKKSIIKTANNTVQQRFCYLDEHS
jgi:hypothetical protein